MGELGKFRIAAVIALGIAAIIVLVAGWRETECGRPDVREALVERIGDRLYEQWGPGQAYELAWRPDLLAGEPGGADGAHVCRAAFDYAGPGGTGLLSVDYALSRPGPRGRVQVRLTGMSLAPDSYGSESSRTSGSDVESRN